MNQPAKSQEPSMEEILASIRRIIADDDGTKGQPKASEPVVSKAAPPPRPVMPAPPPAPPPRAAEPAPPPEPAKTQEEIDEMLGQFRAAHAAAPAEPPPVEEPAADILDLTESMAAPAHGFRTIDAQSDVVFEESPLEPPAPRFAEGERSPFREAERALVSSATTAAVDSAFNTLAHTVLVQNARTLEDLVREMLRPMLKTWLDDNLPSLVERLVRAEIERVSRGRS